MAQLILDLRQEVIDSLDQIAVAAKDSRFSDAKGMLELRANLEVRERRISQAMERARAAAEASI